MMILGLAINIVCGASIIGNVYFAIKKKESAQAHCMSIMIASCISYFIFVMLMKGWI